MSAEQLKKPNIAIKDSLHNYLIKYSREQILPLAYKDLLVFEQSIAVYDQHGKDTLWESVFYNHLQLEELNTALTLVYSLLKSDGGSQAVQHLSIDKIDYCTFGNSKPFRIKIINKLNDNYDYFYVKQADASRVFGLELEEILSPNRVNYLVHENTLIEEHIVGIPGDQFVENNLQEGGHNEVRLAKEFVKFNERCYRRLLGDMRAYNFIVDVTPDFDQIQYRIRAIDFDQQCFEGKRSFYLPHYFKENLAYVKLGMQHLSKESVGQYQKEEQSLIAKRIHNDNYRLQELLKSMKEHELSTPDKIAQLKNELLQKEALTGIESCQTMAELVECLLLDLVKTR